MEDEIEYLRKNHIWMLFDLPSKLKVVACKWVFKKNEGISGVGE